ncbi:MAG: glucosaminidase domain-containing protein [Tannerella sp.]|jgi:LysM repeat protein|nr:glucosaminidase domain-containing protein [Tannerella sp.]
MVTRRYIFFILLFLCFGTSTFAQKKQKICIDYIGRFHTLAQKHQNIYKIPASITLAQGLLESGAGLSNLAVNSNNHFGIKCHSNWKGERVYLRDNNPDDCYRKYKKVEDSFEDHSEFLKQSRYSILFTKEITDYKSWARGLQECKYATDKAYANKLIKIIEDYQLYQYDSGKRSEKSKSREKPNSPKRMRQPYLKDDLLYVRAEENDKFDKIASDMGFKVKDLLKYNEVPENFPLSKGDIVYLQKKKKKAGKAYLPHTVKIGESMHSISQRYGIQVKKLYKINRKNAEYVPMEGDVLRLR